MLGVTGGVSFAKDVTLTYVYWGSPNEKIAIENALADFETAHPGIRVRPMYLSADFVGTEFSAKMKALAQANVLPDLGYFREEDVGDWYAAGRILDLARYVERDGMDKDYLPQVWMRLDDKIVGSYTAAECQVLFYNKDVLREAGVPEPPTDYRNAWTWDEFVAYAREIVRDRNGRKPGEPGFDPNRIVRYGIGMDLWWAMLFPPLWSNGGDLVSRDGTEFLLDKPESIEVIQKIADLIHVHHVMPYADPSSAAAAAMPAPAIMLANGQLGFFITGQWELLDLAKMDFSLGVGALPIWKKPAQMYISGASVIFQSTPHPEEAWELHKWMMTPEKTLDLYTSGLWMPTKVSWYTNPTDLSKWIDNPVHPKGYKEAVVDSMEIARVVYSAAVKNFARIWGEAIAPELDKVWLGKATAEEAVKAARERVTQLDLLQGAWW